ncbi:unnamed protein product, partial [Ectocarpus fasciculatus]
PVDPGVLQLLLHAARHSSTSSSLWIESGGTAGLPQESTAAAAAAVAPLAAADSDAEAFERVTLARRSTQHFDRRRPVPDDVLKKVVALVLGTPSGFNAQPYECIVVTSDEAKHKLSKAM